MERTPLYVFAWSAVEDAMAELESHKVDVETKHWLSLKTQPVAALLDAWRSTGRGVEVVSEYELRAARAAGYGADGIVVNGVGKQDWLRPHGAVGMRVHFDSVAEVVGLRRLAAEQRWRVGLRLHVSQEHDPDEPMFCGQFGMTRDECGNAVRLLLEEGVVVEGIHFHLRSNVERPQIYGQAISEVRRMCEDFVLSPRYLDCGGGLPVPAETPMGGHMSSFALDEYFDVISAEARKIPSIEEVWLENGRFLTARSGVLVVRVIDTKERGECRYLICDGGRTNHALVSDWETHDIDVLPERAGAEVLSTVCGPTCMAYDRLRRMALPGNVVPGDVLVWHNAGAYHVPWETRFSHGLAAVLWEDGGKDLARVRERESFAGWWGQWAPRD